MMDTVFHYVGFLFFCLFLICVVALIINFYFSYVDAPGSPKQKLNKRSNRSYDDDYDKGAYDD